MTSYESGELNLEKHAAKSLALYREKIRPLVYPQQCTRSTRAGCWSST